MAATSRATRGYWAAAGLILLAGAAIRLYRLGAQLIIDDEWHALNVVHDHGFGFIATHFGHADYSIPMALLFEALQRSVGLDEWSMRAPSVLAGIALIAVFPLLMRPWLHRDERLLTAALLAISPFLINFSRVARPYALLALLAAACLPLAWLWWNRRHRAAGWAWYGCSVLAGWLSPVSLAVTLAPGLWFAGEAAWRGLGAGDWRPARRLLPMGLGIAATLGALLYPPLSTDFASLAVKAGLHEMNLTTLQVALGLFAGSGSGPVVAVVTLFAAGGLALLFRRDRGFAAFVCFVSLAAGTAVWLTGAEWIHHGLVPARYLIGLQPVFLALAALGLGAVVAGLQRKAGFPGPLRPAALSLALVALFLAGPVPGWDLRHGQFSHHLLYQFDFDARRSEYRRALAPVRPEAFYREIGALYPAGDAVVVEAPWYLESHWNPLPIYQRMHGQQVRAGFIGGLCAGPLYGELDPAVAGLKFRNFVWLSDLLRSPADADYLVLRRAGVAGARPIDMQFAQCLEAVQARFGPPWRSSAEALVFRLAPGA